MGVMDSAQAADGTAIRGDLPETVSLLALTEGITAEDLDKPVNAALIAGSIACLLYTSNYLSVRILRVLPV